MGGSGSTRRVTIEEAEGTGVVKISESVLRRLKGEPEPSDQKQVTQLPSTQSPSRSFRNQQKDEEIKKLEISLNQYKERLKDLEFKNAEIYQTSTEQFQKAVEEVEQKFLKTTASPVCSELQEKVLKCYQENPKYTLNCSAEVREFSTCVHKARETVLTNRG